MATDTPKPVDPVDDSEYISGWTIQQGPAPAAPESTPGNVVLESELPWEDSLERAGIDPEQYRSGLVIAKDVNEKREVLGETVADKAQKRGGAADANSPAAAEGDAKPSTRRSTNKDEDDAKSDAPARRTADNKDAKSDK